MCLEFVWEKYGKMLITNGLDHAVSYIDVNVDNKMVVLHFKKVFKNNLVGDGKITILNMLKRTFFSTGGDDTWYRPSPPPPPPLLMFLLIVW